MAISTLLNIYLLAKSILIREYVQSYDESIKKLEDKLRELLTQKSKREPFNEP